MIHLFKSTIGRLRIIGFTEGITLLILVFIAVPLKYFWDNPVVSKTVGPVHGALFLLFIFNAISAGIEHKWRTKTTITVIIACFIPFGTFYIDRKILSKIKRAEEQ